MKNDTKKILIREIYLYVDERGILASKNPSANKKKFIPKTIYTLKDRMRIPSLEHITENNLYFMLEYAWNGNELTFGQKVLINALKEELLIENPSLYQATISKAKLQSLINSFNKYSSKTQLSLGIYSNFYD